MGSYNSVPSQSMGQAFKNFILALALPTFINAQCLNQPTSQPTNQPTPSTTPTTNSSYFDGTAACPPNQCWVGGCDPDPNICQIICDKDTCNTACPDVQLEVADMSAEKCSALCIESRDKEANENPCRFWRYDKVSGFGGANQTCTLLASDPCPFHADCSGESCTCEDVGCPGENGATEAPKKACLAPIEYYPGSAWIHWTCYNTENPVGNPYNPDTILHADTKCHTTQKCADWEGEGDRELKVTCDGINGEGENGKWVPDQPVGNPANYDDVLDAGGDGVIKEHKCKGGAGAELVVTLADVGEGGDLSCETPDTDDNPLTFTISAPNKCVLLCDYHLAMVIEGRLDVEGEFKFFVTNVDPEVEVEQATVGDTIKCW